LVLRRGDLGENFAPSPPFTEKEFQSLQKTLSEKNYDSTVRVYRNYLKRISDGNEKLYLQLKAYVSNIITLKKETANIVVRYFCNYANFIFKASLDLLNKDGNLYLHYLDKISWLVREVAEEFVAENELNYFPVITSNDPVTLMIILSNDISVDLMVNYSHWKSWMHNVYPNVTNPRIDHSLFEKLEFWHSQKKDKHDITKQQSEETRNYQRDQQYNEDRRAILQEFKDQMDNILQAYDNNEIDIFEMEQFLEEVLQEDFEKITLTQFEGESDKDFKERLLDAYEEQMTDAKEEMENLFDEEY
jgi:hypothetical protein